MLQKVNRLLTILMYSLIGVFIGYSIYTCADYRARPGLYELYSAPWYTPLLLYGACVLALLAVLFVARLVIRHLFANRQRAIAAAMRQRNASRDYDDDWYPVIRDDVIACITKEKTYPWDTDALVKTYKCLVFWRSDRVYMCVDRFVELPTNEYRCSPRFTRSICNTLESFTEMSEQQFVDEAYSIWCNGAR